MKRHVLRQILCPVLCLVVLVALAIPCRAAVPEWLAGEIRDPAVLDTPGVYVLSGGRLLVVGTGRITGQLRQDRAERLASLLAENDAKERLAIHLFSDAIQKQAPRRFTVRLAGAETAFRHPSPVARGQMLVGLVLSPEKAQLIPVPPLEGCYDVIVAPLVEELLALDPPLIDGGGRIFPREQGWVALGVGFAALPEMTDPKGERDARIIARVAAREALTETFFGSRIKTDERAVEVIAQGPGGDRLREWMKNTVQEDISGVIAGAEVAGEWKTADGHLGVAILVGRSRVPLATFAADSSTRPAAQPPPGFTMEDAWQQAFLQRPLLLRGGAGLHEQSGQVVLLIAASAPLQGNPALDATQMPLLAEVKARNQAARYLAGVTSSSTVVETEEQLLEGAEATPAIKSSLHKLAGESVQGVVQGMRNIGSWQSQEGTAIFYGYIVPLP